MNKIEKQKNWLIGLSIGGLVLGLILIMVGVVLIVSGAFSLAETDPEITGGVLKLVFGFILTLIGIAGFIFGVTFVCTGKALVATKGSVAEGNLGKGTVNMLKCLNCGHEITNSSDAFCGNCGKSLAEKTVCTECGATNVNGSKKCTACGGKLTK